MPERVTPADPGLLASLADQIALPGFAARNLMRGDLAGAGRNLADFGLNLLDAPLPGDLIPEISGTEDRPEFTDIVGPIDDGPLGSAINFAGNVVTDPLTFVPGSWVAKAGGAAAKGVKAVTPEVIQKGAAKVGKTVRRTFGAEKIGKPLKDVITRAQGAKEVASRSSGEAIVEGLKGSTKRELEAARDVLTNVTRDKATKAARVIDDTETLSIQDRLMKYVMENPDVDADRLSRIVNASTGIGEAQWASGKASGPGGNIFTDMAGQPTSDVVMGAVPGTTGSQGIRNYFPHIFKDDAVEDLANRFSGAPSAVNERKLTTAKALAEHLNKYPELELADLAEAMARRGAAQGELAARGAAGKGLMEMARDQGMELPDELLAKALPLSGAGPDVNAMLSGTARPAATAERTAGTAGDVVMGGVKAEAKAPTGLSDSQRKQAREWLLSQEYKQADPLLKETAEAIAKGLSGDERDVALTMLKGLGKRGAVGQALSGLNAHFKRFAVYGAFLPRIGTITRNLASSLWSQASNAESRGVLGGAAKRFVPTWIASIEDGIEHVLGRRVFTKNEFAQVDDAFKRSGGDPRKALDYIKDPTMRGAVERGVLGNNFVDTESLVRATENGGWRAFGKSLMEYPAIMGKGSEQRMRYGVYKDLVKSGKSEDDAARIVRDAFFDYNFSSNENRLVRDYLPFIQYPGKAIPQQAKVLAENPWLASTIANAYAPGRDEPVLPQMEGKINIPFGEDEQGNRQYISNLGLPFESLGMLPNLSASPLQAGRDIEQNIIGATQPALKAAYSYISGRDPFFGSMPGSYTKVGGEDLGKAGSVINQLLNSGAPYAAAVTSPLSVISKANNENTSWSESALNQLTGARIQSVDPDKAIQDRLQAYLERDPSVSQFRTFYSKGEDDVTAEGLLENLKQAQKSLKEKRKAMANVQ